MPIRHAGPGVTVLAYLGDQAERAVLIAPASTSAALA